MKKLLWAVLPFVALPVMASAQFDGDPSTKPAQENAKKGGDKAAMPMMKPMKGSAELKKLNWMVGDWKLAGTGSMGPNKMKITGTCKSSWEVGDAWLVSHEMINMGKGMPSLHGHLMITFDATAKQYVGYWMDDTSATVTSMKGDFTDENTMVFKSDAANGMPATTYTMKRTKSGQTFEMKSDDGSMTMNLGYSKVVAKKKKKPAAKPKVAKPVVAKPPVAPTGTPGTPGTGTGGN